MDTHQPTRPIRGQSVEAPHSEQLKGLLGDFLQHPGLLDPDPAAFE